MLESILEKGRREQIFHKREREGAEMNRAEVKECMKKKSPQVNLAEGRGFLWGVLTTTIIAAAAWTIVVLIS